MQRVYIVEDDDGIREMVMYALRTAGFDAYGIADGDQLFPLLDEGIPDMILLDIMLPGSDGITLLQKLKQTDRYKKIPVIMLTAKGSEIDRIKGLDLGADDYITKPFSVMEVISRIKAVLRRSAAEPDAPQELSVGQILLNQAKRTVSVEGDDIALTYKEFELLQYLMINFDIVLSRDKLLEQVWGFDYNGESRTVDMHIKTLRQKLGAAGSHIKTVRNVGYKIGA